MLVLSRRSGQKVVFRGLGITIDVKRSRGSVVRLGINAPDDVAILRDEVMKSSSVDQNVAAGGTPVDRERHHQWQNELNEVMLKVQLLQRQLELGQSVDLELRLGDIFTELTTLERATTDAVVESKSPRALIVEDHRR